MKVAFSCERCGAAAEKESSHVNRSRRLGRGLYCDRACAGLARRKGKTKAQRIAEKKAYDHDYRLRDTETLKARKRAYHLRTYDPVKEAAKRKEKMPRHVEYCRQPEYRAWKREYDKQYRASKFGSFAECYSLLLQLNTEIASRMSRYDIYMANGRFEKYYEKRRQRRLENAQPISS